MNIFVLDDDKLFCERLCELLYENGNIVYYCDTAETAANIIEEKEFDLYIIDLMLPPTYTFEGIRVLELIRKNQPLKNVVMISSKSDNMTSTVDSAYQLGVRRFIDKNSDWSLTIKSIMLEVKKEMSNSIFISHGHDELLKLKLRNFLERDLSKNVMLLSELPNNGMTVVEKLEYASTRCNIAIILLTKDDKAENGMRARQNVIHEIGFFQGKYGRKNVILLAEKGVELFTNISGILRIEFERNHFEEAFEQIRRELKQ